MEFGDFSSLAVEYPDYNSLGVPLQILDSRVYTMITSESTKHNKIVPFPGNGTSKLS